LANDKLKRGVSESELLGNFCQNSADHENNTWGFWKGGSSFCEHNHTMTRRNKGDRPSSMTHLIKTWFSVLYFDISDIY